RPASASRRWGPTAAALARGAFPSVRAGASTSRRSRRSSAAAATTTRPAAASKATRPACAPGSPKRSIGRSMPDLSGVVVVDKPSGPTSFDVVRRVRGLYKTRRAGHTGTLDPTATGVLPICIGEATKVASFVSEGEKEYDAVVRFGQTTDTQDAAGKVLSTRPVDDLSEERVRQA